MSRAICRRPPTRRERLRECVAGIGAYETQLKRLGELAAVDEDGTVSGEERRAIAELRRAGDEYADALRRVREMLRERRGA